MDKRLIDTLDANQRRALENVRAAVGRLWSRPLHRYYTDHTITHSERVIALLDGLTAGMMATDKRLSPAESFVLLSAAYLHDIGMQDERFAGGDPSAGPSTGSGGSSGQALEEIRARHHEITAELIYRAAENPAQAVNLGLPGDPGLIEALALVAKGHRKVNLDGVEYDPLVHGGETLRLRLLAALLRFGDELDIDHRRVDIEQMKLLTLPVESQLHWWKCHYVSGVGIVDEYIRIVYRFPQDRPDYESLIVPLVEGDVRARHTALEGIFRADAVKVALAPSQVRLMRLVQFLPPEVEALARGPETGSRKQEARDKKPEVRRRASTGKRVGPVPVQPAPVTVFDQRGQTVGEQVNVAGDYVDRRTSVSHRTAHRSGSRGRADWDTAAVRELLTAAFSDGELTTLCFDHFHPVYENFTAGMSKGQKIQHLLDRCVRRDQLDVLLQLVEERNPAKYAHFAPRLCRKPLSEKDTSRLTEIAVPPDVRGPGSFPVPSRSPTGPIRDRWALLVGVDRYVDPAFPPLKFCVNDVLALERALKGLGYTVVALHDDADEERLLPTRDNVEAELARLVQVAGPDDLLLAHFACHGKLVDGQPVLVTRETRAPTLARKALPLAEVERQIRGSAARRLILTLDACHTGVEIGRDLADPEFIRHAYELAEGFALIAASTAQQVAQEWEEKAHGVFTYYLLEGLSGQADRAGKGFVTVDDLKTHVLSSLRRWNVEHGGLLQEPNARTEGLGDIILADHRDA